MSIYPNTHGHLQQHHPHQHHHFQLLSHGQAHQPLDAHLRCHPLAPGNSTMGHPNYAHNPSMYGRAEELGYPPLSIDRMANRHWPRPPSQFIERGMFDFFKLNMYEKCNRS